MIPKESVEYGVFPKGGDEQDAPLGNITYPTKDRAQAGFDRYKDSEVWLELRKRSITTWTTL